MYNFQGGASVHRQIQFLDQLLSLVPGCKKSAKPRMDAEALLNELYAAENLHQLTQMLKPTLDPWPAHIKYVCCLMILITHILTPAVCVLSLSL